VVPANPSPCSRRLHAHGTRYRNHLQLALDEVRKPGAQQVHRLADTFVVGDRHW